MFHHNDLITLNRSRKNCLCISENSSKYTSSKKKVKYIYTHKNIQVCITVIQVPSKSTSLNPISCCWNSWNYTKIQHYTRSQFTFAKTTVECMVQDYSYYFCQTNEKYCKNSIIFFVLTFPAVAKYSPSGDHDIKCTDVAVLQNTRAS